MKTPIVLLSLVVVAGVAAFVTYKITRKNWCKTTFCLTINQGQRVLLKDISQEKNFEEALQAMDPGGSNGTDVNIKPDKASNEEVHGPTSGGAFVTPLHPAGPPGSMHNTQRIAAKSLGDLQSVLSFLDGSRTNVSSATTPTPTPTATP